MKFQIFCIAWASFLLTSNISSYTPICYSHAYKQQCYSGGKNNQVKCYNANNIFFMHFVSSQIFGTIGVKEHFLHMWHCVPLRYDVIYDPFPYNQQATCTKKSCDQQWLGILLMTKIDRAHKNYLTREIWEEMHLIEIFYGTLIFQQSHMICIGRHVGGPTFALQHDRQATWRPKQLFACIMFDSNMLRCAVNVITIIFSTISFKCKISVQKEVIHSFKNHVTSYEHPHFKKMVWVWKTKSLFFCLKVWPTNCFLTEKSYNFHFHKNDVTWLLCANGLFSIFDDLWGWQP